MSLGAFDLQHIVRMIFASELSFVSIINAAKMPLFLIGLVFCVKNSSNSDEYHDFHRSFEAF